MSFVLLLLGTRRGGNIRIQWSQFTPDTRHVQGDFPRGHPVAFAAGAGQRGGPLRSTFRRAALAIRPSRAMSIVTRVMQFAVSAVIGFGQGFQPICGFNYGARRYDRVRNAFWFSARLSFGGCCWRPSIVGLVFAPAIVELFFRGNPEVTAIGAQSLRLQSILLPLNGFLILSNMMLQTMGLAREASLVAISRQGLFFLPASAAAAVRAGFAGRAAGPARIRFLLAGNDRPADDCGYSGT